MTLLSSLFDTLLSAKFWIGAGVSVVLLSAVFMVKRRNLRAISVSLPFNLGKIDYELSSMDRVLAWKMYVQLMTRKAALLFDEENDVIVDVYASLYDIFPIARELLAAMPLSEIERSQGVSDLIVRVLNDAIRPHVTKWQGRYRSWWEIQIADKSRKGVDPQVLQRGYPQYEELVADLRRTNTELAKLADQLLAIARAAGAEPLWKRWRPWRRVPALQPGHAATSASSPSMSDTTSAEIPVPSVPYLHSTAVTARKPKKRTKRPI
jgi:hypothetical protein